MYNLETLQIDHPRLKKLNNWTGNSYASFLDEIETSRSCKSNSSTSNSQCNDGTLERTSRIRTNDGALLSKRILPSISQKTSTKVSERRDEQLDDNGTTFVKTIITSSSVLPPIDKGKECVYEQASKHLQDHHQDVQRIGHLLECSRQQQMVSLQEKIKQRQKLKEAEEKEKEKQKDDNEVRQHKSSKDEETENETNGSLSVIQQQISEVSKQQTQEIPGSSEVTRPSNQRNNSITLIKIEGKRKKKLVKLMKVSCVVLVMTLLGVTLSLLKQAKVTDEVGRLSNESGLGHFGQQMMEKPGGNATQRQTRATDTASSSSSSSSSLPSSPLPSSPLPLSSSSLSSSSSSTTTTPGRSWPVLTTISTATNHDQPPIHLLMSVTSTITQVSSPPTSSQARAISTVPFTATSTTPIAHVTGTPERSTTMSSEVSIPPTSSTSDNLEDTVNEAEDICLSSSTTNDPFQLHRRIQKTIQKLNRMLARRYWLVITPADIERGRNVIRKICDLVQDPRGSAGMVMVDLQTIMYLLIDLFHIPSTNCPV